MTYIAALLLLVLLPALSQAGVNPRNACRCETGWRLNGNRCYKYMPKKINWHAAQNACKGMGSQLVMPKKRMEKYYLRTMRDENASGQIWIGLKSRRVNQRRKARTVTGQWWVDGTKLGADEHPSPPDKMYVGSWFEEKKFNSASDMLTTDTSHELNCFAMHGDSSWRDQRCHDIKFSFVCEKPAAHENENICVCEEEWLMFGKKCYKHMGVAHWGVANKTCKDRGARLAMPKTIDQTLNLRYIRDNFDPNMPIWIGMRREYENPPGKIISRWQDDAKTKVVLDRNIPPRSHIDDSRWPNAHCFYMLTGTTGTWNPWNCDFKMIGVVCEKDFYTRL